MRSTLTQKQGAHRLIARFSVDAVEHRRVCVAEQLGDHGVRDAPFDQPRRDRAPEVVTGPPRRADALAGACESPPSVAPWRHDQAVFACTVAEREREKLARERGDGDGA
jgi:hypothetical protein